MATPRTMISAITAATTIAMILPQRRFGGAEYIGAGADSGAVVIARPYLS